ncbi:Ig-like domain-containing protein [Photobacterium galatheae]|uniref:Bacterial Ig-like domain-containing protein n=1 Tax=Photobacterium galatheae TaxID=1654360 RepID=A0A066RUB8_9GAMM|nr:Ig-like domain-containing protein [Photobacterium galatheae]KDM90988.1 hypothetical protein EA58_14650 [Photobacterium galatheae]MCM0149056.1 hypothetical protein [Photobacterium galatheae]
MKKILAVSIAFAILPCVAQASGLNIGLSAGSDTGASAHDGITQIIQPEFVGVAEPNSDVQITLNGIQFKTKTNSEGFFFWQSMPLADGQYPLIAESHGEKVSSSIIIDTSTDITYEQNFTDGELVLSGQGEPSSSVYGTANGKRIDGFVDENGHWDINLGPVRVGERVDLTAIDVAGNIVSHTFRAQGEHRPHFLDGSLSSFSDSGVRYDDVTKQRSHLIFDGMTTPYSEVHLRLNGVVLSTDAGKDGRWSVTFEDTLQDGNYRWVVDSYSPFGDIRSVSNGLTIDTYAPEISVADFPVMQADGTVQISGTVGEAASIQVTVDNKTYNVFSDSEWSVQAKGLSLGKDYHVGIESMDYAGNSQQVYRTLTVIK